MLKKLEGNKNKDVRALLQNIEKNAGIMGLDGDPELGNAEAKKITRSQRFLDRLGEKERQRQKRKQDKEMQEKQRLEEKLNNWFKPEMNNTSLKLVQRQRKKSNIQVPLYERVDQELKRIHSKQSELKREYEDKENEAYEANCSFQPNVSSTSNFVAPLSKTSMRKSDLTIKSKFERSKSPSDHDSFLQKQYEYEQRRRVHLKLLQEEATLREYRKLKGKPDISERSKELAENSKSWLRADERLYQDTFQKEKRKENLRKEIMRETHTFKPNIKELTPTQKKKRPAAHTPTPTSRAGMIETANRALMRVDVLMDDLEGSRNIGGTFFQDELTLSKSPTRSILKTSNSKRTGDRAVTPTPQTRKKVYYMDRSRPGKLNPDKSYYDREGVVNILLDKHSIAEIKDYLNGGR